MGESFADHINGTLGFGLTNTTVLFSAGLIAVMIAQFRLRRYVPGVYWLAVVLISVVGTLVTDNLTDARGVPLWLSTTLFAITLAVVFVVWYARERTLSIHSIVTSPARASTGSPSSCPSPWVPPPVTGPWTSPAGARVTPCCCRQGSSPPSTSPGDRGAGAVLCFWLAYILTRPLGANIGDFLGFSRADGGIGLGTFGTSLIFLTTILGVVVYLTKTRKDQTEARLAQPAPAATAAVGAAGLRTTREP